MPSPGLERKSDLSWQLIWSQQLTSCIFATFSFLLQFKEPAGAMSGMFMTRSEYDRGVNTFSPEGRLIQVLSFTYFMAAR